MIQSARGFEGIYLSTELPTSYTKFMTSVRKRN